MPSGTSGGRFVGLVEDLALGQNTVCVGDFLFMCRHWIAHWQVHYADAAVWASNDRRQFSSL